MKEDEKEELRGRLRYLLAWISVYEHAQKRFPRDSYRAKLIRLIDEAQEVARRLHDG